MCHEIYGLKHPHHEWEGILALDIWYQLLYRAIDEKYPFDETKMGMNPMFRKKVETDSSGSCTIKMNGEDVQVDGDNSETHSSSGWGSDAYDDKDVYVWDDGLWTDYVKTAQKIHDRRPGCVTPRGVLERLYGMVARRDDFDRDTICRTDSGDFGWFH